MPFAPFIKENFYFPKRRIIQKGSFFGKQTRQLPEKDFYKNS